MFIYTTLYKYELSVADGDPTDSMLERNTAISDIIYHKHHIIPKHVGGSDDPSNIVLLTIEEHALAHKKLWEKHGRWQDYCAYKMLSNESNNQQVIKIMKSEAGKLGGYKSKRPKSSYANGNNTAFRIKKPCIHCGVIMDTGNLQRYHNDKCKLKSVSV